MNYLFGFGGRFARRDWWLAQFFVASAMALTIAWFAGDLSASTLKPAARQALIRQHGWALLAPMLACGWVGIASTAKRFHDRDKSGWWWLVAFIPIVGPFWQLIECGFLRGVPGPNGYGDPPDAPAPIRDEWEGRAVVASMRSVPAAPALSLEPSAGPSRSARPAPPPVIFGRRPPEPEPVPLDATRRAPVW
jgi:uncharacterized membrane protein YhaH (DUF805 family)